MGHGGAPRLLVAPASGPADARDRDPAGARLPETGTTRLVAAVEGSPLQAAGFKALLTSLSSDLDVAATGSLVEVLGLVERRRPDIAIMDVRGAGPELSAVVRQLQERHPATRVVLVVESLEHLGVQELLRLGVSGVFSNQVSPERLLAALHMIKAGNVVIDPTVLHTLLSESKQRGAPLTAWELRILKLVAEGLQNDVIARQLGISTSTLKRNLQTILGKLKVSNRAGAAAYAAKAGPI
jgi:two-component system, NarL family, nitrate/nitrite response regulator NarL